MVVVVVVVMFVEELVAAAALVLVLLLVDGLCADTPLLGGAFWAAFLIAACSCAFSFRAIM